MKINKKLAVCGLALLIILWAGNIIYYENQILKEPLFIKHYYDTPYDVNEFRLYCIENANSKDAISSIVFPEISNSYVNFTESYDHSWSRYYNVKVIIVKLYSGNSNTLPPEYNNKVITKALIGFSNGKSMTVDLGKIYLCSDKAQSSALKTSMSSVSSDNIGRVSLITKEDINITGINSNFYDGMKDILKIDINGKELSKTTFPVKLKSGDQFTVDYTFNFNKNDIRKLYAYNFTLNLLTEDSQGTKGTSSLFITSQQQLGGNFKVKALEKNVGR